MEPRARAGKNVGKMNFSYQELTQFLIAHGDSRQPLPDTIRVLDEILTEFIQGVSFEATRVAQLAGRQKVKYEDFQFAMRKNPVFLGKAAENKELREIIDKQRRVFNEDEMIKEDVAGAGAGGPGGGRRRAAGAAAGAGAGAGGGGGGGGGASAASATAGGGADGSDQGGAPHGGGADVDEEELGEMDDVDDAELIGVGNRRA